MKRTQRRGGRGGRGGRVPREIRVRATSPRMGDGPPDVWVVNGRVIRYLDPMRPEDGGAAGPAVDRRHVLRSLLGALRQRHARH